MQRHLRGHASRPCHLVGTASEKSATARLNSENCLDSYQHIQLPNCEDLSDGIKHLTQPFKIRKRY